MFTFQAPSFFKTLLSLLLDTFIDYEQDDDEDDDERDKTKRAKSAQALKAGRGNAPDQTTTNPKSTGKTGVKRTVSLKDNPQVSKDGAKPAQHAGHVKLQAKSQVKEVGQTTKKVNVIKKKANIESGGKVSAPGKHQSQKVLSQTTVAKKVPKSPINEHTTGKQQADNISRKTLGSKNVVNPQTASSTAGKETKQSTSKKTVTSAVKQEQSSKRENSGAKPQSSASTKSTQETSGIKPPKQAKKSVSPLIHPPPKMQVKLEVKKIIEPKTSTRLDEGKLKDLPPISPRTKYKPGVKSVLKPISKPPSVAKKEPVKAKVSAKSITSKKDLKNPKISKTSDGSATGDKKPGLKNISKVQARVPVRVPIEKYEHQDTRRTKDKTLVKKNNNQPNVQNKKEPKLGQKFKSKVTLEVKPNAEKIKSKPYPNVKANVKKEFKVSNKVTPKLAVDASKSKTKSTSNADIKNKIDPKKLGKTSRKNKSKMVKQAAVAPGNTVMADKKLADSEPSTVASGKSGIVKPVPKVMTKPVPVKPGGNAVMPKSTSKLPTQKVKGKAKPVTIATPKANIKPADLKAIKITPHATLKEATHKPSKKEAPPKASTKPTPKTAATPDKTPKSSTHKVIPKTAAKKSKATEENPAKVTTAKLKSSSTKGKANTEKRPPVIKVIGKPKLAQALWMASIKRSKQSEKAVLKNMDIRPATVHPIQIQVYYVVISKVCSFSDPSALVF